MNPWENIPLADYEKHMRLPQVQQLQALHRVMQRQLTAYPIQSVAILGVAGGNGLDLIDPQKIKTVFGIDINATYLHTCQERYAYLGKCLVLLQMDLRDRSITLPKVDLMLANLFIEYVGTDLFCQQMKKAAPSYLSCVIQKNPDETFISASPYETSFSGISKLHQDIEEDLLTTTLKDTGFTQIHRERVALPNGKQFIRLDYQLR